MLHFVCVRLHVLHKHDIDGMAAVLDKAWQAEALEELSALLAPDSAAGGPVHHLLGRAQLRLGDLTRARQSFYSAAAYLGTPERALGLCRLMGIASVDQHDGDHHEAMSTASDTDGGGGGGGAAAASVVSASSSLTRDYFLRVMQLCEETVPSHLLGASTRNAPKLLRCHGAFFLAAEFCTAALTAHDAPQGADDAAAPMLWANLFKYNLDLGRIGEAFTALSCTHDKATQLGCLQQLIEALCERGELQALCELPFGQLQDQVRSMLTSRADAHDIVDSLTGSVPDYYAALYAFHVYHSDHWAAAFAMHRRGIRLARESIASLPGLGRRVLEAQRDSFLLAATALRLVDKAYAWLTVEVSMASSSLKRKRRRRNGGGPKDASAPAQAPAPATPAGGGLDGSVVGDTSIVAFDEQGQQQAVPSAATTAAEAMDTSDFQGTEDQNFISSNNNDGGLGSGNDPFHPPPTQRETSVVTLIDLERLYALTRAQLMVLELDPSWTPGTLTVAAMGGGPLARKTLSSLISDTVLLLLSHRRYDMAVDLCRMQCTVGSGIGSSGSGSGSVSSATTTTTAAAAAPTTATTTTTTTTTTTATATATTTNTASDLIPVIRELASDCARAAIGHSLGKAWRASNDHGAGADASDVAAAEKLLERYLKAFDSAATGFCLHAEAVRTILQHRPARMTRAGDLLPPWLASRARENDPTTLLSLYTSEGCLRDAVELVTRYINDIVRGVRPGAAELHSKWLPYSELVRLDGALESALKAGDGDESIASLRETLKTTLRGYHVSMKHATSLLNEGYVQSAQQQWQWQQQQQQQQEYGTTLPTGDLLYATKGAQSYS